MGEEAKDTIFVKLITQPQIKNCLLRTFHIYQTESNKNKPDFFLLSIYFSFYLNTNSGGKYLSIKTLNAPQHSPAAR